MEKHNTIDINQNICQFFERVIKNKNIKFLVKIPKDVPKVYFGYEVLIKA